ncbi:MAG: hypothetical protein WC884_04145 [Candidatus Paceibacterota bacterium]
MSDVSSKKRKEEEISAIFTAFFQLMLSPDEENSSDITNYNKPKDEKKQKS